MQINEDGTIKTIMEEHLFEVIFRLKELNSSQEEIILIGTYFKITC